MLAVPRRTAQVAATSVCGYGIVTVSDEAVAVGLALAAAASIGALGRDLAHSRARSRRRTVDYVEQCVAAAAPIGLAFADEQTEYPVAEAAWIEWREETRRGLPPRFRSEFVEPDPATRRALLAGRPITSSREAAAAGLRWDLHQLRRIEERLQGAGERLGPGGARTGDPRR